MWSNDLARLGLSQRPELNDNSLAPALPEATGPYLLVQGGSASRCPPISELCDADSGYCFGRRPPRTSGCVLCTAGPPVCIQERGGGGELGTPLGRSALESRPPETPKVSCVPDIYEVKGLKAGSLVILCCDGVHIGSARLGTAGEGVSLAHAHARHLGQTCLWMQQLNMMYPVRLNIQHVSCLKVVSLFGICGTKAPRVSPTTCTSVEEASMGRRLLHTSSLWVAGNGHGLATVAIAVLWRCQNVGRAARGVSTPLCRGHGLSRATAALWRLAPCLRCTNIPLTRRTHVSHTSPGNLPSGATAALPPTVLRHQYQFVSKSFKRVSLDAHSHASREAWPQAAALARILQDTRRYPHKHT